MFAQAYFADPVWDIMLDLFDAQTSGKALAASSLLIAATVPPSTGLRRIRDLVIDGVLISRPDPKDGRRTFLELAPAAYDLIAYWLRAFSAALPPKAES